MEYLFSISVEYDVFFRGNKSKKPIYAVAKNKDKVKEYVKKSLKKGIKIKSIRQLGRRLGTNMFHGE